MEVVASGGALGAEVKGIDMRKLAHIDTFHFGAKRTTTCHNFHCPYPPYLSI